MTATNSRNYRALISISVVNHDPIYEILYVISRHYALSLVVFGFSGCPESPPKRRELIQNSSDVVAPLPSASAREDEPEGFELQYCRDYLIPHLEPVPVEPLHNSHRTSSRDIGSQAYLNVETTLPHALMLRL